MTKKNRNRSFRIAMFGLLTALAMILSYLENLLPISIGIPGIKLGLANLVVLVALYSMSFRDALAISVVRLILVSFTFGNMAAFQFALAGALFSYLLMVFCIKRQIFGKTGVSIVGGVGHNIGQLLMASFVLENTAVFTYLPVLLMSGMVTGALIGILGGQIIRRIPRPDICE